MKSHRWEAHIGVVDLQKAHARKALAQIPVAAQLKVETLCH